MCCHDTPTDVIDMALVNVFPCVLTFAFNKFKQSEQRRTANGKTCGGIIVDGPQTTSNLNARISVSGNARSAVMFGN